NSILDWLSWGLSRYLGWRILKRRMIAVLVGHAFIDLGIAVVLLGGLAFLLAGGAEGVDLWIQSRGHDPMLQVETTLLSLRDPFGEHRWITWMLLSTLIPTFFHLLTVFFAFITLWPKGFFRKWAYTNLENYHNYSAGKPPLQLLTPPAAYLIGVWFVAGALLWGVGWGILEIGSMVLDPAAYTIWWMADLGLNVARAWWGM
ncbi:MAG: hypothetical protein HQL52_05035, partial [Magnetococcales bacterium]|nr:hypothetical protein [Magnetococcales bacterium]